MNLACPKCNAPEVRKLALIYNEGLSTIHTQTTLVGGGMGGGGSAFGSASGTTHGRQQTALSAQAAPPSKKRWILWAIGAAVFGIGTLGSLSSFGFGTLVAAGLTALCVHLVLKGRKYNAEVHPGLFQRWQQSFMCNRCGDLFVLA